jgi:hypothetical protein
MLGYNLECGAVNQLHDLFCFDSNPKQFDDILSIFDMQDDIELAQESSTDCKRLLRFDSKESDMKSSDQAELTVKHTASTQETLHLIHDIMPKKLPRLQKRSGLAEREIFLHSKMRVRAPRRKSFDLGDLRSLRSDSNFDLFEMIPNSTSKNANETEQEDVCSMDFCVDKEQINAIYNQIVDAGKILPSNLLNFQAAELKVLEKMLWLRLIAAKVLPSTHTMNLLSNLESLNSYLGKSICSKKRTEEQLKKQFKTVLKIMLEQFKLTLALESKKTSSESKFKDMFLAFYFGSKSEQFSKLFKCVQMSREFYSKIFSFPLFKTEFSRCSEFFIDQFLQERTVKTSNLISSIYHELISNTASKIALRTPWTLAEAKAAQEQMNKLTSD